MGIEGLVRVIQFGRTDKGNLCVGKFAYDIGKIEKILTTQFCFLCYLIHFSGLGNIIPVPVSIQRADQSLQDKSDKLLT
jgi:hypothetical protein